MCMRLESDRPKSGGWIHRLTDARPVYRKRETPQPKRLTDAEQHGILEPLAVAWASAGITKLKTLAGELGVSLTALAQLQTGWDGQAWTNPEKNHLGQIVGIKRRLPDTKLYHVGGRAGLTYCSNWQTYGGPVFVVEGASDTAAGLTMGLAVIGRPSNVGGIECLAKLLRSVSDTTDRRIIFVAERDRKKHEELKPKIQLLHDPNCKGCRKCWPGMAGAKSSATELSKKLGRIVNWSFAPGNQKDLRAWLNKHHRSDGDDLRLGRIFTAQVVRYAK
jgi:hypothetical protein